MNWTTDLLRSLMWMLTKFGIYMMNMAYGVLTTLLGVSLDDYPFVWSWLKALFYFLAILMLGRLFILIIYALTPVLLPQVSKTANEVAKRMPVVFGLEDSQPSTVVASAVAQEALNKENESAETVSITFEELVATIEAEKNGINQTERVDNVEQYKYFKDTMTLITCVIISLFSGILMLFMGIQVAQRLLNILLSVVVIPLVASQMIDPESQALSTWYKLLMAELLTNVFQMILFWLAIMATLSISGVGAVSRSLLFIGMLMGVLEGPTMIASLFGSQIGVQKSMQSMSTLIRGTNTLKTASFATVGAGLAASAKTVVLAGDTITGKNAVGAFIGGVASGAINKVKDSSFAIGAKEMMDSIQANPASKKLYDKTIGRVDSMLSATGTVIGGLGNLVYKGSYSYLAYRNPKKYGAGSNNFDRFNNVKPNVKPSVAPPKTNINNSGDGSSLQDRKV